MKLKRKMEKIFMLCIMILRKKEKNINKKKEKHPK